MRVILTKFYNISCMSPRKIANPILILVFCSFLGGCFANEETEAQEERRQPSARLPSVDVIRVNPAPSSPSREYIGNTAPQSEIILRSQAEGQLLNLTVNVGDKISRGQIIGQLDDTILKSAVTRAEGELRALEADLARAMAQINDSETAVESARAELQQAQIDADRLEQLYQEGAVAKREVEVAKTQENTAIQAVASAQSQVKVREAEAKVIEGRIKSQQAIIDETKQRLSYTQITASNDGYILQRLSEPGNLIQPGGEIVSIGDFQQVKVIIAVSELELTDFQIGQPVTIKLDALPNQILTGQINSISPVANTSARQIPMEIIINNPNQTISGGLLARVSLQSRGRALLTIPQTALDIDGNDSTVFIINPHDENPQVTLRNVTIGDAKNGQVEILQGLQPSERLVVRSNQPLENGKSVNLSVISEP